MIEINGNIVKLSNSRISYSIFVSPNRKIAAHLHFGKKGDFDPKEVLGRYQYNFQLRVGEGFETVDSLYDGYSPVELGSYLRMDLRPASIIVRQGDSRLTDFRVKEIKKEAPRFPAYWPTPKGYKDLEWLCLVYEDIARPGLKAKGYYAIYEEYDVLLKATEIVNETGIEAYVEKLSASTVDFPSDKFELEHYIGGWGWERRIERFPLHHGGISLSSYEGRSGHAENPYFCLHGKEGSFGFNLIYSGQVENEITLIPAGVTRVSQCVGGPGLDYRLAPNESLLSPLAVLSYGEDEEKLIQTNHRYIQERILPESRYKGIEPIVFNSWEGAMMDFDTLSMEEYAREAKRIGAEVFVLDDGWFSSRNDDRHGLGDWRINERKIDLAGLERFVHALGMDFGLWIEPEMVNDDVKLFKEHPEYALSLSKERLYSRNQLNLDWSDFKVVKAIEDAIFSSLEGIKIDYIKLDMNRWIGDYVSHSNREGEISYRYVDNLYRFLSDLLHRFDLKLFETCASGGGRFDLGMLCFSRRIWASDNTNPADRYAIQQGTAKGYPLVSISSHVSSFNADIADKIAVAFFGTYGYEMDPRKLSEEELRQLREGEARYRAYHRDCIEEGLYFDLGNQNGVVSMLGLSQDRKKAVLLCFAKVGIEGAALDLSAHLPSSLAIDGEGEYENGKLRLGRMGENQARLYFFKNVK